MLFILQRYLVFNPLSAQMPHTFFVFKVLATPIMFPENDVLCELTATIRVLPSNITLQFRNVFHDTPILCPAHTPASQNSRFINRLAYI